jgi:NCS1 family nucleobase:cation symporter-1
LLIAEDAPWDPVTLLARLSTPWIIVVSMIALALATLSTNIAANVVAPANSISNLAPRHIGFRMGGLITGCIGILMMPWKLLATAASYIFTWLIGYSALLGPIVGIMIADYYIVRRCNLSLPDLYKANGQYWYSNGFHWRAIIVLILAILPNLPGFLVQVDLLNKTAVDAVHPIFNQIYPYTGFVGFGLAFILYLVVSLPTLVSPQQSPSART